MIALFVCLGLIVASTEASTRPTPDQIAAMQTFVRAETRGPSFCPEVLAGLPPENLARIPQMLVAEFRTRWDGMSREAKEKFFRNENRLDQCRVRCRCEFYLEWIEEITPPSPIFVQARAQILKVRDAGPPAKTRTCASANREWICRHPFFKDLVDAAKEEG